MTPVAEQTKLRIRQTHLRHLEEHCPAMAYALSVEGREGPSGPGAERGTAVHDVFDRYVTHLYRIGRQTDWDAMPQILAGLWAEYPRLSYEQREDIAAQAETIAQVLVFNRDRYYGSEEPFEAAIPLPDGRQAVVTGRIDYLEVDADEGRALISDVKSNHAIWPDSKVRDDFQLRTYAMLVLENLPHVEVVEGRLLLTRYGRYLPQKGEAIFTREDTDAFKAHLGHRLQAHFDGRLRREHVPGTWCQYCPVRRPGECTLWRSYNGTTPPPPATYYQARKLARQVMALEQARETRLALLKEYVNEHGPLRVADTDAAEVFAFHESESEEIAPTDLMQIIDDNFGLVGPQPLDELLSVNKRAKAFRNLRYHKELRDAFDDVATTKARTTFAHKAVGDHA